MTYLLMAEILHQLIGSLSIGFHTSQVVQDFSHQRYDTYLLMEEIRLTSRKPKTLECLAGGLPRQLPAMSPNKLLGLAIFFWEGTSGIQRQNMFT